MTADLARETLQGRTAKHYDAYPFDFLTPQDEAAIALMQPAPFRRFVETYATRSMQVGEIGCGPGRATMYLAGLGLDVTALDLSSTSIAMARKRAPNARFVQGSNLALPFADESFELVVSDGVVHHTPDPYRAFAENVRVLKPDGYYYLAVYNRRRYYYYLYTFFGVPVRLLERSLPGRAIVYATIFPLYYAVHLLKSRGKRSLRGARNFFYDYIITPQASFHTQEEVECWAAGCGLDVIGYDPTLGNVHVFILRKHRQGSAKSPALQEK